MQYVARPLNDLSWEAPLCTGWRFFAGYSFVWHSVVMLCFALATSINGKLPSFVIPVVLAQIAIFESFAIMLIWQQCNPPRRWIYGEYAYQWLSLQQGAPRDRSHLQCFDI